MISRDVNGKDREEKPLVLVVDDDPNVVALARGYLERDGYRVIEANDGARGLELARKSGPAWWCWTSCCLAWTGWRSAETCKWNRWCPSSC